MKLNRKQKLFIFFIVFLVVVGIRLLYYSNRPRNLNILLITIDSLRPDHLGCYGYKRNTSPNIDKLAREGVLFTQAISQDTWTLPSIYSLITATYPSTHKVYFYDSILPGTILTLPYILKKHGYVTIFISSHIGLGSLKNSLGRDFDIFEIHYSKAEGFTEKAISWIKKSANKKFFLWMHYMDTHELFLGFTEHRKSPDQLTPNEIENYMARYDEAIHYVDTQISVLLKELKDLGLYKNTIIVITADHGIEIGEHSMYFCHGGPLWDSLIKIPLIFHYPKIKNRIISSQVQLIDIAPTICDLLGIRKPKTFEGKSFLLLTKKGGKRSPFCFSEHTQTKCDFLINDKWFRSQFSVRSNDWKLILTLNKKGKEYQLYNLKIDPKELNNLIDIEKEQLKFLKAKLEEWMNHPKLDIHPYSRPLDEETKERLKSLGYLR